MRRILCVLALTPAAIPTAQSAGLDASSLISRLARPAPAAIAFTEVRFSPLLQAPLVVSGELEYAGGSSFDRRVDQPYREETRIRGDSVRVDRDGEKPRSFALKRAPELRGLLTGFTGLLAGDRQALEREFEIAASGDESDWKLSLTPLDSRARARLQKIEVDGSGSEPRCFSLLTANGGASIMLLGTAGGQELPANVTREALKEKCDGTGHEARGAGQNAKGDAAPSVSKSTSTSVFASRSMPKLQASRP